MAWYRELVIESKLLVFAKEGDDFRISKQGWKVNHKVVVGRNTLLWLAKVLEDCLRGGKQDVYSVVREGYQSFVGQRCENSRGRYLSIPEYDQAGRRSLLCFPEGKNGWGWKSLKSNAVEMAQPRSANVEAVRGAGRSNEGRGPRTLNRTFSEVLKSTAGHAPRGHAGDVGGVRRTQPIVRGAEDGRSRGGQLAWESSRRMLELQAK